MNRDDRKYIHELKMVMIFLAISVTLIDVLGIIFYAIFSIWKQ